MADNTVITPGATGDAIRDKDRSGVKTQIVGLDLGIGTGSEVLMAGSLPVTNSADVRYAGSKSAYAAVLSTAGDTAVVTPGATQKVRLVWVAFVPNSDNTAANLVTVKFGSTNLYVGYAMSHWEVFDGAVGQALTVNLANTQPVAVTVHYQLI
jgi:hypothetical protein